MTCFLAPVCIFPYFNRMYPHSDYKIKPGCKKTEKMRHMSNIRISSKKLTSNFNQCINEYHHRSRNRNNAPYKKYRTRKEDCIGKKQGINRAACSQQKNLILPCKSVNQEGEETTQHSGYQIEKQKFTASYCSFQSHSKYQQGQHIKKDMLKVPMHKHVGQKLPVHVILLH